MPEKFIGYSVGLRASGHGYSGLLVKAEFTRMGDGRVKVSAASGESLGAVGRVKHVFVTADEWSNRPNDPYDSIKEARWAFDLLGFELDGVEDAHP